MPPPSLPVPLPFSGASDKLPYSLERGDTVPPESISNVVPFTITGDRVGLETVPGVSKAFSARLGFGVIQGMLAVERRAVISGYTPASCYAVVDGESVESGILTGNAFVVDSAISMDAALYFDVTTLSGPVTNGVQAAAVSPDDAQVCLVTNYLNTVTGRICAALQVRSTTAPYTVALTITITDAAVNRFVNAVRFTRDWLIVCTNEKVQVYSRLTGALVQTSLLNNWSSEAVGVTVTNDGPTSAGFTGEHVYVAFTGSATAGTATDAGGVAGAQTIEPGTAAQHFRAGVMKFRVSDPNVVAIGGVPLTQVSFGAQKVVADPFYESAHGYFRISEQSFLAPRGCLLIGLTSDVDHNVIVIRSNAGYGPTTAGWPPDGASISTVTVMKITPTGAVVWEADHGSILEAGGGGYLNDLPTTSGDETSLMAVATDQETDVYVGGRRNSAGASAFKLRSADGALLWRATLMAGGSPPHRVVREGGIAVNAAGNPVFVGDRGSVWTSSFGGTPSGIDAHMWELDAATGEVVKSYDLGAAVSGLSIAAIGDGRVVYGTDKV